jgi:hypothetical protein
MAELSQKNIDQYLEGKKLNDEQRERILLAITHMVYSRNQNVIKVEQEQDMDKKKQLMRSIEEYDSMIDDKIGQVLNGKSVETYDF